MSSHSCMLQVEIVGFELCQLVCKDFLYTYIHFLSGIPDGYIVERRNTLSLYYIKYI
nr:MAG TPA: hypothetical protein [Caudoviricetes sp.]